MLNERGWKLSRPYQYCLVSLGGCATSDPGIFYESTERTNVVGCIAECMRRAAGVRVRG